MLGGGGGGSSSITGRTKVRGLDGRPLFVGQDLGWFVAIAGSWLVVGARPREMLGRGGGVDAVDDVRGVGRLTGRWRRAVLGLGRLVGCGEPGVVVVDVGRVAELVGGLDPRRVDRSGELGARFGPLVDDLADS